MNSRNADIIVSTLDNYYKNQDSSKLATVDYPESIEYRSKEWLIYIFYSCILDYGMKSINYHKNLINTYNNHKEIFNPKYVINKEELLNIIKTNIHPRYPNIALEKWINLSSELSKYDNLLNTISSFNTFNELNTFIRSIKGYGQKTGGLLIRLIYEANICSFNDKIKYIPLDRHDIEISYLNGIIDTPKLNSKEIEELSDLYIKSGEKLGIDANLIDKYLWNVGTSFCNTKKCDSCPLKNTCKTKKY